MAVFIKNGAWWIDFYTDTGRRRREKIGGPTSKAMKKVAEAVLHKRRVEIAENKYLDKRQVSRLAFDQLADAYLTWAETHHADLQTTRTRVKVLRTSFGPRLVPRLPER
jgi:hypothetical protein